MNETNEDVNIVVDEKKLQAERQKKWGVDVDSANSPLTPVTKTWISKLRDSIKLASRRIRGIFRLLEL